ncbi:long-chain-fatty-acid--CoA ligase [Sphingomonas mollis]|uniref:Long-chain-fatty-acid--CoA ligase n=1 Tax=Sphingomonas mollis TaxID=2795726 RepID=A0ABS0XUK6_9SPHN|nr:long-chain-fatty-acid--CoA ligase [Sphingomonas sp. BT553]MBJ6123731.1 long-chain-fatty-acid--CoA ligase [Sphingomonas sp. BT553]
MPLRFATRASEAYDFPLTIGHLLDAALTSAADQEIVYRDRVRMTYRDLRVRIGRLASALAGLGVGQGTVVAMMDWDSHRYLEAYFAIPMMGAVLQTVNVRLPIAQIGYTLRHAEAEVVICHRDFLPALEALLPTLEGVTAVVVIDDGADEPASFAGAGEYEALLAAADPVFPFVEFDENALATTFYTTGTTGDPKGVCFSHRQIVLLALATKGPFGTTRDPGFGIGDVYMPLTPMFHVHAWCLPYVATLLGVKQVYPGRYEADMICRLRTTEHVTYSHCVPTVLQMIFAAADKAGTDLVGWTMTIGGSALTHALWEEGKRRGMSIGAGYGMSETGPTLTMARRNTGSADAASDVDALTPAGIPIALVSLRVVDEAMCDVSHDGVSRGEVVVRAPWLTPCYIGNAEASRELWRGGWMHTQDVATISSSGRVVICDRLKDVIKTGGEWIPSLELEDLIASLPEVAEVAVVGVPDKRWGERPVAVVVAAVGAPSLDTINTPITAAIERGDLSRYARLDRVEIVDALPRTSVGKIDKKALRFMLT